MKVVLSRAAHADIAAIGDFIANDNPPRAATFVDELKQHCLKIGLAPYAHPVVRQRGKRSIRRAVHGSYLILYETAQGAVRIVRVIHGARDWERLLFPPE
jgi:toxin ParE1/3/4